MGPIKTNWPAGALPPARKRMGRKAREARALARLDEEIAKIHDADKIRARFARLAAADAPTVAPIDPVTRPEATPVPCRLALLPTRKAWRDMQAHVPPHVAAFWAK